MPLLEPLLFEPILKGRAWGSDRLRHFGKRVPIGARVGESWELADLPDAIADGRSHVACGPFAGATLRQILSEHRSAILGDAPLSPEGGFPLLVKLLDAHEHLSVQVHPDAAYAASHPDCHLKTEAWVILEAEAGAVIFRGVDPSIERDRFFEDLNDMEGPGVLPHLISVPVERGDCIYLPSGICHALGAGIIAAEVQTPSDTTFRVFDWNRNDPGRPLHVEQARRCMRFGAAQEDGVPGVVRAGTGPRLRSEGTATRALCATDFFSLEWVDAMPGARMPVDAGGRPVIWCVVGGSAELRGPHGRALRLRTGDTALLPAALEGWTAEFTDRATVLRTSLPVR
jgi:mannose-6-phosphate isomerase